MRRDDEVVELRRKAWELLCLLVERAGQLVRTEDLLAVVWPGTRITPQTLTNVISDLRSALGDSAAQPRWIQTVRGRGYRFIGAVAAMPARERDSTAVASSPPRKTGTSDGWFVGRSVELRALREAWNEALAGRRATVLVAGEAGIGKTTLVEAFATETASPIGTDTRAQLARAHCIEQHGPSEPYLPVLDALGGLLHGRGTQDMLPLLARYAPTWLLQLPWLLEPRARAALAEELRGTTPTRMLREGVALLEALAERSPLLLVLEDLHWSDAATLDLISALARCTTAARLMLVCTYRATDAVAADHDIPRLAAELCARHDARGLALVPFDLDTVRDYLRARLGIDRLADDLAEQVEQRSAGNPLYVRAVVDRIAADVEPAGDRDADDATARPIELPTDLRAYVVRDLESLAPGSRTLLEAAAVCGVDVAATEVATCCGVDAEHVERELEAVALLGRLLVRAAPKSAAAPADAAHFAFVHATYGQIVYDSILPARRRRLHRCMAEALVRLYDDDGREVAGRIAAHYHAAGQTARSVPFLEAAARTADARFAYREASEYLRAALERIASLPASSERSARESDIARRLGDVLVLCSGYSSDEVNDAFARAATAGELAAELNETAAARMGQIVYLLTTARYDEADQRIRALRQIAESDAPGVTAVAHCYGAYSASSRGRLTEALELLAASAEAPPSPRYPTHFDVRRLCKSQLALVLTEMGRIADARAATDEAVEWSRAHGTHADLGHATMSAVEAAVFARDLARTAEAVRAAGDIAERTGLLSFSVVARFFAAWCSAPVPPNDAMAEMVEALAHRRTLGDRWQESVWLTLIADAELLRGDADACDRRLDEAEAFARATGEEHFACETTRVRAASTLLRGGRGAFDRADSLYRSAASAAERTGARLFALRIATHWADALAQGGLAPDARFVLEAALAAMPSEDACPDRLDAVAMLARIGR